MASIKIKVFNKVH